MIRIIYNLVFFAFSSHSLKQQFPFQQISHRGSFSWGSPRSEPLHRHLWLAPQPSTKLDQTSPPDCRNIRLTPTSANVHKRTFEADTEIGPGPQFSEQAVSLGSRGWREVPRNRCWARFAGVHQSVAGHPRNTKMARCWQWAKSFKERGSFRYSGEFRRRKLRIGKTCFRSWKQVIPSLAKLQI